MIIEKPCPRCKKRKPFEEWSKHKNRPNGVGAYCKKCNAEKELEWRTNNPERHRENYLKNNYRLSTEEYNYILDRQGGTCALCLSDKNLCIDHDHKTGQVRGILCREHNKGLGLFKDDVIVLKSCIEYLTQNDSL